MSVAEFFYTTVLKPPLLKSIANKVILALLPKSVKVGNATIVINPNDPVVSGALTFGVYEKSEIAFMQRILKPGAIMLDIGANVGLYSALGGLALGEKGRIIAFEPDPESRKYLKQTIDANALSNTEVISAAASNNNGTTQLFISTNNRGDNRLYENQNADVAVDVATVRIDDVLNERNIDAVDIIKIDVQGFEGYVIEGMEQTLKNSQRLQMLMEFWPEGLSSAGTNPLDLLNRLESFGLSLFELKEKGNFTPIDDKEIFIKRYPGRAYTNLVVLGPNSELNL